MKLSKVEKKVFVELKNKTLDNCKREMIDEFDCFYEEDIEYRLNNIDVTIKLLKEEKALLGMLLKS
jgi:hypothetical protein